MQRTAQLYWAMSRLKWRVTIKAIRRAIYGGVNEVFDLIIAAINENGFPSLRSTSKQWEHEKKSNKQYNGYDKWRIDG